jgi:hypothetical protein
MAELLVEGDELVLRLSAVEKVEGVHGEVRVPLRSVTAIEALDNAIQAVHGFRVGTGIPGTVAVGTFTSPSHKIFAAVHHNSPRGVRVALTGAQFDELIVGCPDPSQVVTTLRSQLPQHPG